VRKITINRGVAHQMLHHLGTWSDANGYTLIAKGIPEDLAKPLIKRGFIENDNDFIRNPK
jgi:hypothetical protein